ncbi:uncharacterized protein LOC131667846 [Phymastichus coffea]|uniref:uncharacterized protein LOC131667846 n=1 Tax=Phymastichus coffea TaxID=108790 RepID=UPI00273A95DE|nr:uncharacterized protein LOC131667846 [Phymastichus coffea]XP_058797550.1 uncharacterized protein LOC131667846 [Phymastichus coffea]XP_058797551.1 uncharacterized protein LOC131667846 [Phymastichus coffea]
MTHPGIAVMLMVGVGLGAVLYYFFASTDERMGQSNCRTRCRPDNNNRSSSCWNPPNSDLRNRRPDQSCPICFEDVVKDTVRVIQCMHAFHKSCIEKWKNDGSGNACNQCPICRKKIEGLEEF